MGTVQERFDRAVIIKQSITVPNVLTRYGFDPKRRMKCPIHGGDGDNFEVKERTWKCYSHCGNGDVISLVQLMFGLDFQDAMRKLDDDFGLGIFGKVSQNQLDRLKEKANEIEAKRKQEQMVMQSLEDAYDRAYAEWVKLDQDIIEFAPRSPFERMHPYYINAIQQITTAEARLNQAEGRLIRWKLTRS